MRLLALVVPLALLCALGCGPEAAPPPVAPPPVAAQPAAPVDPYLAEPLPLDARVKKGKLDSGLTYYVMQHKKPEHRAQIWLAVNAGSVLEDEDQRGLAHFVEHMGFNGTKRFPKNALVDVLERSGVSFGADLNAYTNFDETVYTLTVPTDNADLLGRAIGVVRDWAGDMTFDPTEVEKERGVVLEEWRLGRGAHKRLFDLEVPVLLHGSKYADRVTIGKPEIITGAPREALVRFYKQWYRPELMAVIAVGDFSPAEVEAKIKEEFASLPASQSPHPRAETPVPAHAEPLFSILTDAEQTGANITIMTKIPHRPMATVGDERRAIAENLYNAMLNARFEELRRKASPPFLSAGSWSSAFVRPTDTFSQYVSVKEGGVQEGYAALLEEMLRVERHGFTASELERAKRDTLRSFERSVKERATSDSRGFAAEIVRNFLKDEGMPGPEAELAIATKVLPTITLEELNQIGKTLGAGSRVVTITGPASMPVPTEASLVATMKAVAARDIAPYVDAAPSAPLMATVPAPGRVVSTRTLPEIGVTEWTLANGVRVVVKPTDFKSDEVRLFGFAPGGTSMASDADYDSVKFADTLAREGGLGPFDAPSLRKALSGKVASVFTQVGELEETVHGSAAPSDLETMFQMVHLRFAAPRRDDAAIAAWRAQATESVKNRRLSPDLVFYEDLGLFSTQGHRRRQPNTPETLAKLDVAKALDFYKDRFADASGFTFFLVGAVDLDRAKGLVETYLGSLPGGARKEAWKDIGVRRPKGVAKKAITAGSEPKARVELTFHGNEKWSRDAENDMHMLGSVLGMRLREILREDMGGVYGVRASGSIARRPRQEFSFSVAFGCAPENVEKLERAAFDEIKAIQKNGIPADYITKVKEIWRREYETRMKDNGFWSSELAQAYRFGDDPKLILDWSSRIDKVSSDRVRAAAKKYVASSQYILGELRPASAGK